MKRILFLLLIIGSLSSCKKVLELDLNYKPGTQTTSVKVTIPDSCVLYLPFNKDTKDYSSYGNNGIGYLTQFVPDRFGKDSSALLFTDTSYVKILSSASLNFDSTFSLNSWIQVYAYPPNNDQMRIISKERISGSTGYAYGVDYRGMLINSFNNIDTINLEKGINFENIDDTLQLTNRRWYMVSFIYDGKNAKSYINGKLISNIPIGHNNLLSSNLPLFIGKEFSGNNGGNGVPTNRYFNGVIDDVRLYRKPLSENDINTLYNLKQ